MQLGADFYGLIRRFSPRADSPIALAVSGGSDSLALLHLTHDWAKQAGRELLVLTVDHRLRPEAKYEAERVAAISAELGHPHVTLTWETPRASQAAARQGRYELLAQATRRHDAACLLTGHSFDDVVETAMIRRRRGVRDASIAGPVLAAPVPAWPAGRSITLLRPLIHRSRSDLRTYLEARGQDWVDDPSNANPAYERVRVRAFLARHKRLGQLAKLFIRTQQEARSLDQRTLGENLSKVQVDPCGLIDTAAATLTPNLIKLLIRCASGSADDPRDGAVRQLLETLTSPGQRQTLGGAWLQRSKTGLLIGRDPATMSLSDQGDLFDGRFERDEMGNQPAGNDLPFLVRQSAPPGPHWREIISERLEHLVQCYQTPLLSPVQR